jgi:hypothetical protein
MNSALPSAIEPQRHLLVPAAAGALTIGALYWITRLLRNPEGVGPCQASTLLFALAVCMPLLLLSLRFLQRREEAPGTATLFGVFLVYGWLHFFLIAVLGSANLGGESCVLFDWDVLLSALFSSHSIYQSGLFLSGALACKLALRISSRRPNGSSRTDSGWAKRTVIGIGYVVASLALFELSTRVLSRTFGFPFPVHILL